MASLFTSHGQIGPLICCQHFIKKLPLQFSLLQALGLPKLKEAVGPTVYSLVYVF